VALVSALLFLTVVQPPVMSANDFLQRAQSSSERAIKVSFSVIHQRIKIRQGEKMLNRDVFISKQNPITGSAPSGELARAFDVAQCDWFNPLSVDSFARWRASLTKKRDVVSKEEKTITLSTFAYGDGPVEERSITVLSSDWHPVKQRIRFNDRPELNIIELGLKFETLRVAKPSAPRSAVAVAAAPAVSPRRPVSNATSGDPSAEELDDAEIQLREALHRTAADINEIPGITRRASTIHVEAQVSTEARKRELQLAIQGLPHVSGEIASIGQALDSPLAGMRGRSRVLPGQSGPFSQDPPFSQSLWEYFGGMDRANAFLIEAREKNLAILVNASALRRLTERYTDESWSELPTSSQARLASIAADYQLQIHSGLKAYLSLVDPVITYLSEKNGVTPKTGDSASTAACRDWRTQTNLFPPVQQLQTSLNRLFIKTNTDKPIEMVPVDLLRDAVNECSRLHNELDHLCLP
jgi:hypothetical protein